MSYFINNNKKKIVLEYYTDNIFYLFIIYYLFVLGLLYTAAVKCYVDSK